MSSSNGYVHEARLSMEDSATSGSHRFSILRSIQCFLLIVLCGFLFLYRVSDRDLWRSHEGRAAQDAQSILDDGDWLLPRLFDRHIELQKPPMYYWLVAGTARLRDTSVDAYAVRFPAALSALAGVVFLFWFGYRCGRPMAGLLAALFLATAVHYVTLARTGRIDMPLALSVAIALGSFFLARRHATPISWAWRYMLPGYLAMAFGILLKGPVAIVLPLAVAAAFLASEHEFPPPWRIRALWKLLHRSGAWWGVPLVLALACPWFVWASIRTHGSLVDTFFWHHNIERAFGGSDGPHPLRARAWYLYGPYLATYFLPWSLLLPIAAWWFWRDRECRADAEARFGLIWLVATVVILSCARFKRADYLLPAFPGAALFLGCSAERWYQAAVHRVRLAAILGVALAGCVVGWWVHITFILPTQEPGREYVRFAEAIRHFVPRPGLVLFFRTEAHALAFHVGAEIDTFLEWENLDIWAGRPGTHYIVMPAECAAEWQNHVTSGRLDEVLRSTDFAGAKTRERPLVLMRTHPVVASLAPP